MKHQTISIIMCMLHFVKCMMLRQRKEMNMKFGEKVRKARLERGLSLQQLAQNAGISKRALINYEAGAVLPKQKVTYELLANALHITQESLMDENSSFVMEAAENYGARGAKQAEKLVQEISGLYAGGDLAEEDMDAMMLAIQDAYWLAKKKNRKYVPKKYREDSNAETQGQ